jgi:hypothetical protein
MKNLQHSALVAVFLIFFSAFYSTISAQNIDSLSNPLPENRAGIKFFQLFNFLEQHREAAVVFEKKLPQDYYFASELGYAIVKREDYGTNLDFYSSEGMYTKLGMKKLLKTDKLIVELGAFYTFSQSTEKNVWHFPGSYWNQSYLHETLLKKSNHALAGHFGLSHAVWKKFYINWSNTISYRIDGSYKDENFKRVFFPGMGYSPKFDWLTKKDFRFFFEMSLTFGVNF